MSKYPILLSFYSELSKFNNINPQKRQTKGKKVTVYDDASELCNEDLEIYLSSIINTWRRSKRRKRIKDFNSKQIIN